MNKLSVQVTIRDGQIQSVVSHGDPVEQEYAGCYTLMETEDSTIGILEYDWDRPFGHGLTGKEVKDGTFDLEIQIKKVADMASTFLDDYSAKEAHWLCHNFFMPGQVTINGQVVAYQLGVAYDPSLHWPLVINGSHIIELTHCPLD